LNDIKILPKGLRRFIDLKELTTPSSFDRFFSLSTIKLAKMAIKSIELENLILLNISSTYPNLLGNECHLLRYDNITYNIIS
jgi:hypothetical protein